MADSLHYNRLMNHRNEESGTSRKSRETGLRRTLAVLISLLVIVLLGELLFHFLIAPNLELERVQLDSDMNLSLEQVKSLGGIQTGQLFYEIDEAVIRSRLEALPDVRSASVRRIFPNGLGVSLRGRKALAMLMVEQNGITFPALFDEDGVVFRIGLEIQEWELPLISGVQFTEFNAGVQLDQAYLHMLDDIIALKETAPDVLRAFSEFRIDEVYPGVYEWVLMPIHLPVKIRCSPGIDREQVLYILKVLEVIRHQGLAGIHEIDFRTGDVVYSREGGSNGL